MSRDHEPALMARFPGTRVVPLAGIAEIPTPIELLGTPRLSEVLPGALWVKRDDLTSRLYGGNKVRKLDFLLGDALAEGARTVLTFGAYGSNHALATAVHARALGLEPHVVLSPQEPGPYAPATLLAHAGLGTVLHLADGWDGRREAVRASREIVKRDGAEPYVVPIGGTNPLGILGYVSAAMEVRAQTREPDGHTISDASGGPTSPDVVYVAAGTLGTAVGLAIGFAVALPMTRVEAIRVTPPELVSEDLARTLSADTIALLGSLDRDFPPLAYEDVRLSLRGEFFEPGYGVVTPQTEDAVALAADAGLVLETTYTGKAFAALLADAESGRVRSEDHVLFWDTYSSAPKPSPGPVEALPDVLREYVAECERSFGSPH